MTKRKVILLSLIVVFAVIYMVQLTQVGKNTVENITLTDAITGIRITHSNDTKLVFTKQEVPSNDGIQEDVWILDDGTQVESFPLTRMIGQLNDIKVLGSVSSVTNKDRYELQDGKALIVEALNGQEVVRTIAVGKASSTTSQTYAIIDASNDIVLISGDLHDIFDKTREELEVIPEENETTE